MLGKMPPSKLSPGNKFPRKIAPPENCSPENCPPGNLSPGKLPPPPLPLKKYFVKLLHVMEYLSGENFVNFNFRQSWVIIFVSDEIRRLLQQTVILNYSSFEEFVDSLINCNIWKRPP